MYVVLLRCHLQHLATKYKLFLIFGYKVVRNDHAMVLFEDSLKHLLIVPRLQMESAIAHWMVWIRVVLLDEDKRVNFHVHCEIGFCNLYLIATSQQHFHRRMHAMHHVASSHSLVKRNPKLLSATCSDQRTLFLMDDVFHLSYGLASSEQSFIFNI